MGRGKKLLRILSPIPLLFAIHGKGVEAAAQASPVSRVLRAQLEPAHTAAARVTVTWILRDQDLFSCQSAAYDLRALVRVHGSAVLLRVVAVDSDPALVAAFMRRERLNLAVTHLSSGEYRRINGSNPVTGIAVSQQEHVVESFNAGMVQVRGRRSSSSLDGIVRELLYPARYSLAQ